MGEGGNDPGHHYDTHTTHETRDRPRPRETFDGQGVQNTSRNSSERSRPYDYCHYPWSEISYERETPVKYV